MPDAKPTGIVEKIRQMASDSVGSDRVSMTKQLRVQYGKENVAGQMGDIEDTGSWSEWLTNKGYSLGQDGLVQTGKSK